MESTDLSLSEVLHGNWVLEQEDIARSLGTPVVQNTESVVEVEKIEDEKEEKPEEIQQDPENPTALEDLSPPSSKTPHLERELSQEKRVYISPPYISPTANPVPSKPSAIAQQLYYPSYTAPSHAYPVSSTYHQPYLPMVRNKKTSVLASALRSTTQVYQSSAQYHHTPLAYGYPIHYPQQQIFPYRTHVESIVEVAENGCDDHMKNVDAIDDVHLQYSTANVKKEDPSSSTPSAGYRCATPAPTTTSAFISNHQKRCFDLPANVLDSGNSDDPDEQPEQEDELPTVDVPSSEGVEKAQEDEEKGIVDAPEMQKEPSSDVRGREEEEEIIVVDEAEQDASPTATPTATAATEEGETATTSSIAKHPQKSELEMLLSQPVKKAVYQEYSPFIVLTPPGTTGSQPPSSSKMQFYQAPTQQHLVRTTPPPGFAQPYGMGMRPHEEETRQIMNLDNQQTHSSSPTSSWNQPYVQMTNLNTYQPRGANLYAPPAPPMGHQNGPQGVVPTSNPYYQPPPGPPHHHMQPQAPMMAPVMHGQQQPPQPYYNTQSPLTGTPPSMSYGNSQMPAPQTSNGNGPIFNFSKPRNSNESSGGGGHRRKKHNDLSSPRYNNNNSDDGDSGAFPDMSDFPLLDVVQSKAKKDAGRKPCRPHLCEQSRMLISRVCHFHRELAKRLPSRHPLTNTPFSKPDQWTSQVMGISLATVRKCVDMAVEEEVFTRCTDKNLVNLTPAERAEREELLSKLSTVFEDEKTLGAGTAGLTIAEYSPRRSYSNSLMRPSTDDKSSSSSYNMNGAEYASSETTLLNLDDHSNSSKDFGTTPTPTMEMSNGHHLEEIGAVNGSAGQHETAEKETTVVKVETPKRGRPRKTPGTSTSRPSKRKESNEDSEVAEDEFQKDEQEKKTEDEDETNEETEKKTEEVQQLVVIEREEDAASSEGTNRSETATPEPTALATSIATSKKTRATRRKKRSSAGIDEDYTAVTATTTKKKRGSVTVATAGIATASNVDDENAEHKMVTRARSRQP